MSGKAYSNGPKLTIVAHSACDDQTRTFSNEKTKKLWVKLHDKKCEICRNISKKSMQVYKTDIQAMKGETSQAYLDNFQKHCEYV
jgi:hypothetical protein